MGNWFKIGGIGLLVLGAILAGIRFQHGLQAANPGQHEKSRSDREARKGSITTFKMTFVGDLMCHEAQFNNARTGPNSYDFRSCYDEVLPLLKESDFTYGNFESVCAGSSVPYMGYPGFNSPDEFIEALDYAGFDLVSTANNHTMDQGEAGVLRSLSILDQNGIGHTGSFRSQHDHDSVRVEYLKGTRVGFLSYTYGTNGRPIPEGKPWMVNLIDTAAIRTDIQVARKAGAELVTVFFHFGNENEREPNAAQKQVVQHTIACGADIIIGAHPHVIQPVEFFKCAPSATLDTGFVAWSMGNFISNQYWRYTDAGLILNLTISRDHARDSIWISKADYIPTWVYRGRDPRKKQHVVFPAELPLTHHSTKYLNEDAIYRMKEAYADTRAVMASYTSKVALVNMQEWMYLERMKYIAASMHPQLKTLAQLRQREMVVDWR
ncbi:MAG: CapA family protein [Bacteroidia bacterium]|nr:CapA family protein [Bacteroidia bacterium]